MSESNEDLGISLDSSIKKLLKSQFPNQSFRNPVVKAIAICAQRFLEEIIQESAEIGIEKQKNTMTNEHVYEALDRKHFNDISSKAKTIGQEIEGNLKKRKESWNTQKEPQKTEEERKIEAQDIHAKIKLELQKKKLAEAASLKPSDS